MSTVLVFQHVMKFAEMSQEIVVTRSQQVKFDLGLTPGRRRLGEKLREERLREAERPKSESGKSCPAGVGFILI